MKLTRIFTTMLICGFLIGATVAPAGVISAQSETPTPTATFIPPTPSPTPIDLACPVGTPVGYGTYTPSPLWNLSCGGCAVPSVTASPIPTGTPNALGTPAPTFTPTIAPTLFVHTTPTTVGATIYHDLVNQPAWASGSYYNCQNYYNGIVCSFFISRTSTSSSSVAQTAMRISWNKTGTAQNIFYQIDAIASDVYWYTHPLITSNPTTPSMGLQRWSTGSQPATGTGQWVSFSGMSAWPVANGYVDIAMSTNPLSTATFQGTIYIQPQTIVATPQPVPTATNVPYNPNSYCGSVVPVLDDFGFDLFAPVGEPNCAIGWDGFTIGETEYGIPAVQICLVPSNFGVIRMFGRDFPIGDIALAVAGAFFYRFLSRV